MRPLQDALLQYNQCLYKKTYKNTPEIHRKRPFEDMVRKESSASQEELKSQKETNLPASWSWTSSLQDCEKVKFYR